MRLLATLGRHTKLDGVGISDLFHMGDLALTFDPANVKNVLFPAAARESGALLADFADDAVLQTH